MKKIQRNQEKDKEEKQEEKKDENKNKPKREGKIKVPQGGTSSVTSFGEHLQEQRERENKEVPAGGERRKGN
jgi:hypothetical protein